MYLMIEAWSPRPAWLAMNADERAEYLATVGGGMQALSEQGVRPLGWGFTDEHSRGVDHLAFAVWDCGTRAGADALRDAITQAGWYELFDQVDFGGEAGAPDAVLRQHMEMVA